MSWLSICFTSSSTTPTMISRLTPLNGNWLATPAALSATSGNSATIPRYAEPGAETGDVRRAEEHSAEFFVDGGEQHEQRGEPGVARA